ncbi:MAG: baseplate J/gp47 family protein [Chloroflexota bacterium]|nr:baseplate J/gp47 family protein [Chloroflexota bacterium]
MKTQIIQLEPYDDIYSVKDKFGWGQATRILLVWPTRGRVLDRYLDLMLLKRHCTQLGSQLALVVGDRDVRSHAQQLGIPVYNSSRAAETTHKRPKRRHRIKLPPTVKRQTLSKRQQKRTQPNFESLRHAAHPKNPAWIVHPITRVLAFTLGVLGVLAIAALLVPAAKIHLSAETQTKSIIISVSADPETQNVDLSGAVPAQWSTVTVEGRGNVHTSGSTPLPDHTASGEVVFTNLTDQEISLPSATIISTLDADPIRFSTTASAKIPPDSGQTTVPVQATSPGAIGNVHANSIATIEGPVGMKLTVTNPRATLGGDNRLVPSPSEGDYQQLYDQLFETLAETALEEIAASLGSGDILISEKSQLKEILEETYTPSEPSPTDNLELLLRLEFQALTVSGADLRELGRSALAANLPKNFSADPDSLDVQNLGAPTLDESNQTAHWRMQAQWEINAQLDQSQAIKLALGLAPSDAADRLSAALPLETPAAISLTPSWWPRLPFLPFRISVDSDR